MSAEVVTSLLTLLAAIVGGVLAIGGQALIDWRRRKELQVNLASSFKAEIASLMENWQRRDYESDFRGLLAAWERGEALDTVVGIPGGTNELEPIYAANASQIGLLKQKDAVDIVKFYNWVRQLQSDIDSLPSRPFHERLDLLRSGLPQFVRTRELGEDLIGRLSYS